MADAKKLAEKADSGKRKAEENEAELPALATRNWTKEKTTDGLARPVAGTNVVNGIEVGWK